MRPRRHLLSQNLFVLLLVVFQGVWLAPFPCAAAAAVATPSSTAEGHVQQAAAPGAAVSQPDTSSKALLGVAYVSSYSTPGFPEAQQRISDVYNIGFRLVCFFVSCFISLLGAGCCLACWDANDVTAECIGVHAGFIGSNMALCRAESHRLQQRRPSGKPRRHFVHRAAEAHENHPEATPRPTGVHCGCALRIARFLAVVQQQKHHCLQVGSATTVLLRRNSSTRLKCCSHRASILQLLLAHHFVNIAAPKHARAGYSQFWRESHSWRDGASAQASAARCGGATTPRPPLRMRPTSILLCCFRKQRTPPPVLPIFFFILRRRCPLLPRRATHCGLVAATDVFCVLSAGPAQTAPGAATSTSIP